MKDTKEQLALKYFKDKSLCRNIQTSIELTQQDPTPIDPVNLKILATTSLDERNQDNNPKSIESNILDTKKKR
jgi:hypothetical protein